MQDISLYLTLNNTNYFAKAEEYIQLHPLFKTETLFEKLTLFMKLIGNLVMTILFGTGGMGLALTVYRMFDDWQKYLKYISLKKKIHEWEQIIHSIGGPFISTNDDTYQAYVYADGMQRLHCRLFGLPEERAKCLQ